MSKTYVINSKIWNSYLTEISTEHIRNIKRFVTENTRLYRNILRDGYVDVSISTSKIEWLCLVIRDGIYNQLLNHYNQIYSNYPQLSPNILKELMVELVYDIQKQKMHITSKITLCDSILDQPFLLDMFEFVFGKIKITYE